MEINELTKVKAELVALQQKLDAVLAENVALRKAHPQPFGPEMMKAIDAYIAKEDDVPEQGMMDAFFILRESITLKSPQVDSILNEIRAEGALVAGAELRKLAERSQNEAPICAQHYQTAALYLNLVAEELRAGSTEGGV